MADLRASDAGRSDVRAIIDGRGAGVKNAAAFAGRERREE